MVFNNIHVHGGNLSRFMYNTYMYMYHRKPITDSMLYNVKIVHFHSLLFQYMNSQWQRTCWYCIQQLHTQVYTREHRCIGTKLMYIAQECEYPRQNTSCTYTRIVPELPEVYIVTQILLLHVHVHSTSYNSPNRIRVCNQHIIPDTNMAVTPLPQVWRVALVCF